VNVCVDVDGLRDVAPLSQGISKFVCAQFFKGTHAIKCCMYVCACVFSPLFLRASRFMCVCLCVMVRVGGRIGGFYVLVLIDTSAIVRLCANVSVVHSSARSHSE
jgi:hypothetical protein